MCARIFYLLLAALFVFLVATVAAFRYLDWWQALFVSAGTFLLLVSAGRWLVRHAVRMTITRFGEEATKGLIDVKSRVLRGATVDVHAVRPAHAGDRPELRWYEIEATIFPDPSQTEPMSHWDVDDLRLVPASAVLPAPFASREDEYEPHELVLVEDGKPVIPVDGKVTGPRRLRFVVGVPSAVRDLQFRYFFEQFGPFRLSANPALPPSRAAE
ncbi:MAG TPA: hypothetical protein VFG68_20260 [Fimbriiglobus sp.]|nr:hypothetical protein [Fimbriiglobus sp.]